MRKSVLRLKYFVVLLFLGVVSHGIAQQETSVLFIGNSFTFYNYMPGILKDIASANGKTMHVDTAVTGGKDLKFHSGRQRTYEMIKSKKWDYIVIQGHSNEFAQPDGKVDTLTLPFAKKIIDSIRLHSPCSRVLFYMTWGYKNGNPKWKAIANYDSMQLRIERQYLRFADLFNAGVVPVGMVWKEVRDSYPFINLYDPDRFHPILTGSYLSACTFYTTIFGETPYKNKAKIAIEPIHREAIELASTKIVLNNLARWRYLPKLKLIEPGFDIIIKDKSVHLVSNAKNYDQVEWDFGDGIRSMDIKPKHIFSSPGEYKIRQELSSYCKNEVLERTITVD
jgi:hypothetical protein